VTNLCGGPGTHDAGIDASADAAIDANEQMPIDGAIIDAAVDASMSTVDAMPDAPVNRSGCADGEREAFMQIADYPDIAGCAAQWAQEQSLRANPTGLPCGDDLTECATPADACAPAWHVCGRDGSIGELLEVDPEECRTAAGQGRFVAGLSHCSASFACEYDLPLPCIDTGECSEPVCCGAGCAIPGCTDGVWFGETRHSAVDMVGCGQFVSAADIGILCCRDD
jgi:hypothetical protein